jgi:hypothetical protein
MKEIRQTSSERSVAALMRRKPSEAESYLIVTSSLLQRR